MESYGLITKKPRMSNPSRGSKLYKITKERKKKLLIIKRKQKLTLEIAIIDKTLLRNR